MFTNFFIYPDLFLHHLARIDEDQVYIVHVLKGSYFICLYCIQCSMYICVSWTFSLSGPVSPPFSLEKRGSSAHVLYFAISDNKREFFLIPRDLTSSSI